MSLIQTKPKLIDWYELISYPIIGILMLVFSGVIFIGISNLLQRPVLETNIPLNVTSSDQLYCLASLTVSSLSFILTVLWLGFSNKKYSWEAFGFKPLKIDYRKIGKIVLLGVTVVACEILVIYILKITNIEIPTFRKDSTLEIIVSNNFFLFLAFIMVIGIIGPIIEEICFRGILFGWFRRYFNPWVGIIISSFVFGLLHYKSVLTIIATFMYGLMFSWLYEREKTLVYPIALHVTINIAVTFVNFYLPFI